MKTSYVVGAIVIVVIIVGVALISKMQKSDSQMAEKQTNQSMEDKTMAVKETKSMESNQEGVMVGGALMVKSKNIVENAMGASNVTTVVAAVKAAGLAETLMGTGPFTVFAPTNTAFEKLPKGTVEQLLMPENKAKLAGILTYHVVAGRYTSSDIKDGMKLKTVNGQEITFKVADGKVWINGAAQVETTDVISSNGITHVIDTVLMPQ